MNDESGGRVSWMKRMLPLWAAVGAGLVAGLASCDGSTPDAPSVFPDAGYDVTALPPPPIERDDFALPVLDVDVPGNAPTLFDGKDTASTGPCLHEPELGSLIPRNWIRPRFRFTAPNQENLFEIRMEVPGEKTPLRIYTRQSGYTLKSEAWKTITAVAAGQTLKVRVRSLVVDAGGKVSAGPFLGADGTMEIAPVAAAGTVVYWTTSGGSVLKGFRMGDETVQTVITPPQTGTACVACHTSTPDGKYVAMTVSTNPGDGSGPAFVNLRSLDGAAAEPPFLTASARTLLGRLDQHAPAFSKAHWQDGDHTALTMLPIAGKTEIVWTNLEAPSTNQGEGWGIVARTGDANAASAATFSHDGQTIVYTSSPTSGAGTITGSGALFSVPYTNRAGGAATAIAGASDPAFHYFYPTFSADDAFLAMNRIPAGPSATSYNNAAAEVFVVPRAGGTPTRLVANDPPACLTTIKSPGITNSWPKWSPEVKRANGKDYYFMVFSSTRFATGHGPQLYVAPIVVSGGVVQTYPALYLWNQPETENNHTPAWDVFELAGPK